MKINILATCKELDVINYGMFAKLSEEPEFNIYIAADADQLHRVKGKCIPLEIPKIRSKFTWAVIRQLRTYVRKYDIDLIYSPGSSGLSNALFATLGTRVRNIGYRGTQAPVKRTDFTYYLGLLNPRVSHIVCETEDIRDYLSAGFIAPGKLSVILKPYDIAWVEKAIQEPRQIEGLPADAITCIYIGSCRKRPFKGLSCLIEAFHLLEDERLHLIHIGDYDPSDLKLAQSGPSAQRIHLLGQRNDAIHFLPRQDIFILPSLRDASPRVIREAMACGLPCIVSDIPGARDLIIDQRTGYLFPAGSPQALADTIGRMLAADRKAMGKAGKERIIADFKVDDYVAQYRELFLRLGKQ